MGATVFHDPPSHHAGLNRALQGMVPCHQVHSSRSTLPLLAVPLAPLSRMGNWWHYPCYLHAHLLYELLGYSS